MNPFARWPVCNPWQPRRRHERWNTPILLWLVPLLVAWGVTIWVVVQAINIAAEG